MISDWRQGRRSPGSGFSVLGKLQFQIKISDMLKKYRISNNEQGILKVEGLILDHYLINDKCQNLKAKGMPNSERNKKQKIITKTRNVENTKQKDSRAQMTPNLLPFTVNFFF